MRKKDILQNFYPEAKAFLNTKKEVLATIEAKCETLRNYATLNLLQDFSDLVDSLERRFNDHYLTTDDEDLAKTMRYYDTREAQVFEDYQRRATY